MARFTTPWKQKTRERIEQDNPEAGGAGKPQTMRSAQTERTDPRVAEKTTLPTVRPLPKQTAASTRTSVTRPAADTDPRISGANARPASDVLAGERKRLRESPFAGAAPARQSTERSAGSIPQQIMERMQRKYFGEAEREGGVQRTFPAPPSGTVQTLTALVDRLPEDFPIDQWDGMTPSQQQRKVKESGLSEAEQWELLNASLPLKQLAQMEDVRRNRREYGLSAVEAERLTAELLKTTETRGEIAAGGTPFRSEGDRKLFLKILDEQDESLLARYGIGQTARPRVYADDADDAYPGATPLPEPGPSPEAPPRPEPTPKPDPRKMRLPELGPRRTPTPPSESAKYGYSDIPVEPIDAIPPANEEDGMIAYIFYTQNKDGAFEKQAEYQKKQLEEKGYDVRSICTNDVDVFQEEWRNMDIQTGAAVILSHSNGMSLIFTKEPNTNAISAIPRGKSDQLLPQISDLFVPGESQAYVDTLLMLACNAGHEELLKEKGTNAADAFRDLPNVGTVYAYDGSATFGLPIIRSLTGAYPPRLSHKQHGYSDVYSGFNVPRSGNGPSGLLRYFDE